jgi:hypothetical protein
MDKTKIIKQLKKYLFYIVIVVIILLTGYFVKKATDKYDFSKKTANTVVEENDIVNSNDTIVGLNTLRYLKTEKNNYMREFLITNKKEYYFDNTRKVIVFMDSVEYNTLFYRTSIPILDLEEKYLEGFIDRLKDYLFENEVYDLQFEIKLPMDPNELDPPLYLHFGSDSSGVIPKEMEMIWIIPK